MSQELAGRLQELLSKELSCGGFEGAVRVCSETALKATEEFSAEKGHSVRRVSLKNRNPNNIPDGFERAWLEKMDQSNKAGELAADYHEVVEEDGHQTLRFLKPLPVGGVCLTCHGPEESIPAEVRAILSEKYPADKATGYQANDIRGAISVKIRLD